MGLSAACFFVLLVTACFHPAEPVLITQSKRVFIHAVPNPSAPNSWGTESPRGLRLLYTDCETGRMRVLLTTGSHVVVRHVLSYAEDRLAGVAWDSERLYAVVGHAVSREQLMRPDRRQWNHTLYVFWLEDGSPLWTQPLGGHDVPVESIGKGPLTARDGQVLCQGTTLAFKGKFGRRVSVAGLVRSLDSNLLVLDTNERLGIDEHTHFFQETGRDPQEVQPAAVLGKYVQVELGDHPHTGFVSRVLITRVQPGQAAAQPVRE